MSKNLVKNGKNLLLERIGQIITEARQRTVQTVNTILVRTYWEIGREIVEQELGGKVRAEYGEAFLLNLAKDLSEQYGRGFSYRNIRLMRQFYYTYEIWQTVSAKSETREKFLTRPVTSNENGSRLTALEHLEKQKTQTAPQKPVLSEKMLSRLSWSHICLLLAVSDNDARSFYEIEIGQNNWSVRETKRQIESMLFERLALSKDKMGMLELSRKGQIIETAQDAVKDPYGLEILGLPENEHWYESDIEQALMNHLQNFMLELGKGFMFVNRQMRLSINNEHYHIDLVFYHKYLKSYILIDLKAGKFDHADYGQMKFYLNYFQDKINDEGDNDPVGIILCYEKDDEFVEYVLKNEKIFLPVNTCSRCLISKNYWLKYSGLKKSLRETGHKNGYHLKKGCGFAGMLLSEKYNLCWFGSGFRNEPHSSLCFLTRSLNKRIHLCGMNT